MTTTGGPDLTSHPSVATPAGERPAPRVVVGVDGSAVSAHALDQARAEAELMGAQLEVVWAWARADVPRPPPAVPETWAEGRAQAWAAAAADGPRSLSVRAVQGEPGPTLVDVGGRADLVVVGAHGRGRAMSVHLGSVSHYVVDHASAPVMVVREGDETTAVDLGGPIAVGVDGSDPSRRALVWALHEAARRRVGVIAVNGWDAPAAAAGPVPTTLHPSDVLHRASERLVHDALDRTVAIVPTVPRTGYAIGQRGAQAVLDVVAASSVSLVVVGCRGRHGLVQRALGSVSHRLVAVAPVPVVTIR